MSAINKKETDNLSLMYEGDKTRDASDKVRGFLFQDYIAIKCLLQDGVEYVCSEYLEDVDVFFEDGRREYTVKLHHQRMARLSQEEKNILLEELSKVTFADSECRVYLKFL